jgi:hypothetical protein
MLFEQRGMRQRHWIPTPRFHETHRPQAHGNIQPVQNPSTLQDEQQQENVDSDGIHENQKGPSLGFQDNQERDEHHNSERPGGSRAAISGPRRGADPPIQRLGRRFVEQHEQDCRRK